MRQPAVARLFSNSTFKCNSARQFDRHGPQLCGSMVRIPTNSTKPPNGQPSTRSMQAKYLAAELSYTIGADPLISNTSVLSMRACETSADPPDFHARHDFSYFPNHCPIWACRIRLARKSVGKGTDHVAFGCRVARLLRRMVVQFYRRYPLRLGLHVRLACAFLACAGSESLGAALTRNRRKRRRRLRLSQTARFIRSICQRALDPLHPAQKGRILAEAAREL